MLVDVLLKVIFLTGDSSIARKIKYNLIYKDLIKGLSHITPLTLDAYDSSV